VVALAPPPTLAGAPPLPATLSAKSSSPAISAQALAEAIPASSKAAIRRLLEVIVPLCHSRRAARTGALAL
jgi:hypothetical protein